MKAVTAAINRHRRHRTKGLMFRAHIEHLEKTGKLDAVLARVSPETAAIARNPPLPGAWVDGWFLNEIVNALYELDGATAVRELVQAVVDGRMMSVLMPVVRAVMRVLGGSPAILFPRYGDVLRRHLEGVDFEWTQTSKTSGTVLMRFHTPHRMQLSNFVCAIQGLDVVFQICSVRGKVSDPEILSPQSARYLVSWE